MSGSPRENVLARLEGVKEKGPGKWMARCPGHEDATASLSVTERPAGQVLLHCFAGCEPEAVVAALGLTMRDLFPQKEEPWIEVAAYDYTDENGRVLYQVVRQERAGEKNFPQRRALAGGGWEWGVSGVPKMPFRLPKLVAAVGNGERVWIPEGEKDVLNLEKWGLAATTNSGGAEKWQEELAPWFKGAAVVILPDNDGPGQKHAKKVARCLYGSAASIRILNLPDLPKKGDVSDWIKKGGTKAQLLDLADAEGETSEIPTTDDAALLKNFEIESIVKVNTDDPVYRIEVMGGIVEMTIEELSSFPRFKVAVMRRLDRMPDMRNPQLNWHTYLDRCLQNKLEVIAAPEEAGGDAALWHRIWRYLSSKAIEDETVLAELRGVYANERYVYFHGPSLHSFLCSRGRYIESSEVWEVLRKRGAESLPKTVKDSQERRRVIRAWRLEKAALELPEAEDERQQ